MKKVHIAFLLLFAPLVVWPEDEMTVYDLLAPESHQFAILYDVAATTSGSRFFFNVIRPGSETTNEKVVDRATGKELKIEMTTAKEAKQHGQAEKDEVDETKYIKVFLPQPVPENGEFRLRVYKTYRDPKSYFQDGKKIVFDRNLSIKRNVIILPANYELIESSVPVIVERQANRIKLSMVNDRNDELMVRIVGRKLQ